MDVLRATAGTARPMALRRTSVLLLDPVALVVLLVLLLHGTPGDAVGAALLAVLLLGRVECFFVDLLGVFGKVVLRAVGKLRDLLVRHRSPFSGSPR